MRVGDQLSHPFISLDRAENPSLSCVRLLYEDVLCINEGWPRFGR